MHPIGSDASPEDRTDTLALADDLRHLGGQILHLNRGQALYVHDPGWGQVCLVTTGLVRLQLCSEAGRELTLYRLSRKQPWFFGPSFLSTPMPLGLRLVADEEARLSCIDGQRLFEAMAESKALCQAVLQGLGCHINHLLGTIGEIAFQRLDERLTALLQRLFVESGNPALKITHQALASDLGTSRVVVSRLLKQLEEGGFIRLGRESIELVSPEALRQG